MDADPGLAFEIWFAIERSGSKIADDVDWAPDDLLADQPQRLFAGIEDRLLRERAYVDGARAPRGLAGHLPRRA